jgi:hypothetical protein
MKRRAFLRTLSLGLGSAMASGWADRLQAQSAYTLHYGVPRPPGPPRPPQPGAFELNEPPYAREVPSIPFDAPPGSWTLVSLPDTQSMTLSLPAEYSRQTDWIVAHRESHDIRFVVHEGDVVEVNFAPNNWVHAQTAMRTLTANGVPYCLLPGNHDLGMTGLASDRFTFLNNYFSADDYRHSEAFGLFENGKMENSWHHFTAPTGNYLVLALEYGPRNSVVEWADEVVNRNLDRKVIVVTHAYLDHKGNRFNAKGPNQLYNPMFDGIARTGEVNDGEMLWNKLIKRHPNIFLVLCGHELFNGTGYLRSVGDHGQQVHQILANYQGNVQPERPYFGGGYLRLMQFHPDGNVQVKSYSPWLNQWLTSPDQQFGFVT